MHLMNECPKLLGERYLKARNKKAKSQVLDEYCLNTSEARKYVFRKIQPGIDLRPKQRKKRKEIYGVEVRAALANVWELFDHLSLPL